MVQETVFARKFDEPRCPLVKEESGLSSEDGNDRRIANLIDFFFTIVKSQKDDRKSSSGSCFKTDSPTETKPTRKVNIELEKKMETLMDFLATTGCMDEDNTRKDDKKITLMEFLFGPENMPVIEFQAQIEKREMTLSESNINVKLSYIDETPVEEGGNLVDMLIKYMENYEREPHKLISLTPCLSEKSKSDVTISKMETFSDNISKTKSDSTLTHTQDTVIEREVDLKSDRSQSSRRISETVVDLSNVKQDLEDIFEMAVAKICELKDIEYEEDDFVDENDTMSEAEDMQNYHAYTKPPPLYNMQYTPYSVELSDIIEEDESLDPSSRGLQEDRMYIIRECAEDLLDYIEDKIQRHFDDSDDEFDISASMKRSSVSLIDLRLVPDLPPSMIIKPKVKRIDRSTSTTEISESISDISRRFESGNLTEDTSLSNSSDRHAERALDKLESLHKFFSRSRLDIIKEGREEEKNERKKRPRSVITSETKSSELKPGQASLDDVEELQDEVLDIFDLEKLSDEVIIEENEREIDYDEIVNEDTTEDIMNIETDEMEDDKNSKNREIIDKNDIKIETVSKVIVTEERAEDLMIDNGTSPIEDQIIDENVNPSGDDQLEIAKYDNETFDNKFSSNDHDDQCIQANSSITVDFAKFNILESSKGKNKLENVFKFDVDRNSTENNVIIQANLDKFEINSQETDEKDLSESDFTDIDKIISDAVKIILYNELEFHETEQKLKQNCKNTEKEIVALKSTCQNN